MPTPQKDTPRRILLCSDGRTDALREALPETSFEVVACPTSESMLEEALQRPPDLILCRQGDPPTADPAALRLLRRFAPGAPLVVLTESTSLPALRLAQEFRPVFFVLEPSEPAELRDILRAILDSSRAGRGRPSDAILWGRAPS